MQQTQHPSVRKPILANSGKSGQEEGQEAASEPPRQFGQMRRFGVQLLPPTLGLLPFAARAMEPQHVGIRGFCLVT